MSPDTLIFFKELEENNNREWFLSNKARWDAIREEFTLLTEKVIDELSLLDPTIGHPDPRRCIYRIYRDLRFTNDKRPYKTHISFFLSSGGIKRSGAPGYYLQIGQSDYGLEEGCSLGGGIFMPDAATLSAIRQEIYYNYNDFLDIINNNTYRHFFGQHFFSEGKLSRAPKGYPNDWEGIEWIKYKDYCTMYTLDKKVISNPKLFEFIMEAFRASLPLNQFIQRAMGIEIHHSNH